MMGAKSHSVAVLDEAARSEQMLNWTLFAHEQDARLWNDAGKRAWMPGDSLGERGFYARPMAQIMPSYRPLIDYGFNEETARYVRFDNPGVCVSCQVTWLGGSICWMCGVDTKPKSANIKLGKRWNSEANAIVFATLAVREDEVVEIRSYPQPYYAPGYELLRIEMRLDDGRQVVAVARRDLYDSHWDVLSWEMSYPATQGD